MKVLEEWNLKPLLEIKERMQKGRIAIVDGKYLMADIMLSCGEVFIRDILWQLKSSQTIMP